MSPRTRWIPYLRPTPIGTRDITDAEEALGVAFPRSYVELLLPHQGCSAEPGQIRDHRGKTRRLGYLLILSQTAEGGRSSNLVDKTLRFRRKGYPSDLVPFATGGGQDHFAMRFDDGANPEVVYVHPDGDAEATGYWTWIPVAPSFDALLLALDRDGS